MNEDGIVDFAGTTRDYAETSPFIHAPIVETSVTTDGGKTIQRVRTYSFRPRCSFVDFDGDGDLDMITESTGLFEGGVRECVSRLLTQRTVGHEIRVHLQNALGKFPETPDVQTRFTIHLDSVPIRFGNMFDRYWAGQLVDLTGDFDGDGYRDLVVRGRPRRLAVYLSAGYRIPKKPSVTLRVPEQAGFDVFDIDGDGRSDIVVQWSEESADGWESHNRVHFARESGP